MHATRHRHRHRPQCRDLFHDAISVSHSLIVQTFQPQSSNLFCFLDWMLDIATKKLNQAIYMSQENNDEAPKV
jgi:hypothetical protein